MAQHARLSASSAERFMKCPGSVKLSEMLPVSEDDEFSSEGTAAHALAELCLRSGDDAYLHQGEIILEHEVTPNMVEAVQVYLDYVHGNTVATSDMRVELSISDNKFGSDFGGTADAIIISEAHQHLEIVDYKHGIGIPVDIVDNIQLKYYAYGVLESLKLEDPECWDIVITIVQPRAYHQDGPIRCQDMPSQDLLNWGSTQLIPAMKKVDSDDAPYEMGEHCRFCDGKLVCPLIKAVYKEFAFMTPDEIIGFDDETLARYYKQINVVKYNIKALQAEAQKRALKDSPLPGTKLVYGKAARIWKKGAEEVVIEEYGDDAFTEPSLKSPAQIEKLPGGSQIAGRWAHKNKGKPILVTEGTQGEAYDPTEAANEFADIENNP